MKFTRLAAAVLLLSLVGAAGASGAAKPDFTGHWSIVDHCTGGGCTGRDFDLEEDLVQSGSKLTGSGGYVVDGSVSGASATFTATGYGGYVATFKVTLSSDGKTLKGSATDTQGQSFTITGQRAGGTVTAPTTPAGTLDPKVPPTLCAFEPSCNGIDVRASGKPKLNTKTGQLAAFSTGCYDPKAAGSAAAHAAQIDVSEVTGITCGLSVEADLSAAGNAEIEKLVSDAQKLITSGSKADQLKGQKLLAQADKRFNQISQMLRDSGELGKAQLDPDFDESMDRANKLLASPDRKDQLQGQKLVEQTKERLESVSRALRLRSGENAKRVRSSAVRTLRALTIASAGVKVAGGKRGTLTLRANAKGRRILGALRKGGLRSVTLLLQIGGARSGDAKSATTLTTLKVALR